MADFLLFRLSLLDLIRPRRLMAAAPLMLIPGLLALLWKAAAAARGRTFDPEIAYNTLAGGMIFGFVLVILAVLFGTGVVAQEVEQRTIVFLLTRPLARGRILLARFLGAFTGITLTVWLATLLLALAVFGRPTSPTVTRDLLYLPVGALAYGGLFALFGALLNRPIIFGLFFAFGWESWVPILPGAFQKVSIMTYLRALVPHETGDGSENSSGSRLRQLLQNFGTDPIPPETAATVLAVTIAVTLVLAVLVFTRREYAPREDAE